MLKSKFALLVAFGALVLGGNARAGVALGISNSARSGAANSLSSILTFNTTSLGGARVAAIGLWTNGTVSPGVATVTFASNLGDGTEDQTGDFLYSASETGADMLISWNVGSGNLLASRTYTVSITGVTASTFLANTGTYTSVAGISDYWQNPTAGAANSAAIQIYYDTTSVPEPGTLILTGSALAAGAVGAYFKRRRKARTEAETVA